MLTSGHPNTKAGKLSTTKKKHRHCGHQHHSGKVIQEHNPGLEDGKLKAASCPRKPRHKASSHHMTQWVIDGN